MSDEDVISDEETSQILEIEKSSASPGVEQKKKKKGCV